ncbi:autotransporter domain-containing protein [Bradyrhizobium diazoefficiens]|uniref:autotransporter outer membrane beta-barrel domain-containing protein n=1 Tax=Bradyrhizobium diazoefficiens TaxID=1355477 RepID=UPI0019091AFE|nr:autotransporter domain-containing protein [Bradyrhizobium diazoefficiens]
MSVPLAGGYTQSSLHVDDRSSSATVNNYHLAVYGGGQLGAWGLRGGAAFTWHDIDSNRTIAFPGFFDATKASYGAHTAQAFGEIGRAFALGYLAAEPFADLAYVHFDGNRFTETGGAAALTGTDDTLGVAFTTLGLRAATALAQTGHKPLTVTGTLAWRHAFGDLTPQTLLTFRDGGAPFTAAGVPIARDSLLVETGLGVDLTADASIGITYSGQVGRPRPRRQEQLNLAVLSRSPIVRFRSSSRASSLPQRQVPPKFLPVSLVCGT